MSNEAKYFEILSGAIAQIDADSFEARGSIYDHLWNLALQHLEEQGLASGESLARERTAFLSAVRRIEFGERVPASVPEAAIRAKKRPKRSVPGRLAMRMASACAVLAAIWFAYLVIIVRMDSAAAERWAGEDPLNPWQSQLMRVALSVGNLFERRPVTASGPAQRAVLYEENSATATGTTFSGQAIWRHQAGSAKASASGAVLSIDTEIPQKGLSVGISIRRAPDDGGAISHFVEFRLLNSDGSASEMVEDVRGILMKTDELTRGIELIGKVVRVQRGVFLMGLSAAEADLDRNLKLLKERSWLDIPIVMKDRTRSILAIEKGSTGQNALNQALASWGQT
jgi:hypothetical protein